MKRNFPGILIFMLVFSFFFSALSEQYAYPVYEVVGRPAILYPTSEWAPMDQVIGGLETGTKVIASLDKDDMLLVSTKDGICGWMQKGLLKPTGEQATVDYVLDGDRVSKKEDVNISYITVDEKAILKTEYGVYPRTLIKGEPAHDAEKLLLNLLGEGYEAKERNEWSDSTQYVSAGGKEPWEKKTVYVYDSGDIWYYDPSVSSERGAEYEPPMMNMMSEESLLIARGLLSRYFTDGETDSVSKARMIQERWSYADRWLTDEEYREFMYNRDLHYFNFEHISASGLPILGDSIMASVGVNGLNGFDLSWHNFMQVNDVISPIPLDDAIKMANSTRMAKATLLYADLVYSNWITESDEYNVSWYLVTDQGSYVVDCVLLKHKCDSYEY